MSPPATPILELELHPALLRCVESCGVAETEERTARSVQELLGALGVKGAPGFRLRLGSGERAVRALVDGVEQPFPPSFLARLWFGVAPRDLHELPFDPALSGMGGGQAWLVAASSVLAELDRSDVQRTIGDLVEQIATEVVSLHPDALLGEEEAVAYFAAAGGAALASDAPTMLRSLLQLGASISKEERVRRLVFGAIGLGRSTDDACEEALALLRAPEIEIQVDSATFDALLDRACGEERLALGDDRLLPALAEAMAFVADIQLRSLGIDVPVALVRSRRAQGWQMQVKINDRLSPPVPLPAPGEVGVSAPPAALEREGIRGRGLVDPVAGAHLSAVVEDQANAVAAAGYVPVLPASYVAGAFGRTVGALGYRLITVDRVEGMLARYEQEFPVLVHDTLARFSLAELTRLLRAMVRERVAIDDLWRILNVLVIFAEVEWPQIPGEDRLAASLARVRLELGDRIAVHSCRLPAIGAGVATVFETEPALEERVERWLDAPPPDQELRATRQAVWDALARAGGQVEPVIVTSSRARAALRETLGHELPDVHVMGRDEIPDAVSVEQLGRIADIR